MKLYVNFFCRDIAAQCAFYGAVLGLPEDEAPRSPIYRALRGPGFELGFNAWPAYELLGLAERRPPLAATTPVHCYPTLMLAGPDAVDRAARDAAAHGGRVLQGPFATYYGQWQAVLADPEEQVFRVACIGLPAGTKAPSLEALMEGRAS